jgi:hypothetical protein
MIKLTELLHAIDDEEKSGLVKIDDWRWPDAEHLINMEFEFADDYRLHTTKDPKITIYKKKSVDKGSKDKTAYFFIEEEKRGTKRFKNFNDVIEYFDKYSQPELDERM